MLVRTFEAVIQIDYLRSELQEYIDEHRIKMSTGLFLYQLEALIIGHRLLICPLAGKRIENVSQSHYPCLERYVLTLEAVRISLAVVLLMMVVRNIDRYGNEFLIVNFFEDFLHDDGADFGMALHLRILFFGKTRFLPQDVVIYRYLTEIVENGSLLDCIPVNLGSVRQSLKCINKQRDTGRSPVDVTACGVVT